MRSFDLRTFIPPLLRNSSGLKLLVLILAIVLADDKVFSQPCHGAPSFTINLSGNPDSIWTSPDTARSGDCCGSTNPDKCVEFVLTLDSQSSGIKLDIVSGAVPGGALFYQIACGTSYQVGQQICLSGPGPHRITFCKPGNNPNVYKITAIPKPAVNGKLLINQACVGYLKVSGLVDTSIHWQSVPSDTAYNSYLSCLNGCDSVSIVPHGNFPSSVTYRVCGIIDGGCSSSTFCDTATVRFVTAIDVDIQPKNPTVCFGGSNTNITAYALGGLKPFTFTWSNGVVEVKDTSSTISVGVGTYIVDMTDSLGCTHVKDTVVVTSYTMPIAALAGNDTSICTRRNYVLLAGSVQAATGGKWIGGTGSYVPNDTTLNATYFPSVAETNAGVANLKLVTRGNGSCPADTDDVQITILPSPVPMINGPNTICAYRTSAYTAIPAMGSTYQWSVTGGTILGSNTNIVVGVAWGASGTGKVILTQTNSVGCDSTITYNVTITPTPPTPIIGPDTVCEYKQITYTTTTGVGNTYLWTVTGGTIIGSNTDSTLRVLWGANGSGSITLKQVNTFNCDSTISVNIVITPTPVPIITGPTPVCEYKQTSYSTNTSAGNTYQWVATGGTIVGSSTNPTVTVAWGANGSGTVAVTQTNLFGCDSSITKSITITPTPAPTITGPTPVCAYKQTSYSTNTTAGNTYLWTVTGGSIIGSNAGSSINVLWSASGSGTVTIKQTNTFTCDSTITKNITINPTPFPTITGPTPVCAYKQTSYSTNTTAGNTYLWTVTGGSIVGSNSGSSITVLWAASGSGTVTVKQTNTFTCDSTVTKNITINPTPAPVITGPTPVCEYKQTSYSTNTTAGNTYLWTVTGGSIVGSNSGSSITVLWGANGSGTVTVKQTNTFTCDSAVTKNITITPTPAPVIAGPTTVCEYKPVSYYSTNTNPGMQYLWTVTGGFIIGNNTDSIIDVIWAGNGSGSVTVKQTNTFNCDSTVTANITITPTPAPVITGPSPVCEYKQTSYSTNTTVGNTYQWTVTGGFIIGSNSGSSINVIWAANGSGTVTVKQTNTFNCDSTITKNITITPTPAPTISGPTPVCAYKQTSYSTNTTAGNTYQWTVTGGFIIGSNSGSSITVLWGASGSGTVTIKQTNTFTCDSTITKNITINPTPAPVITGPTPVCAYKQTSYSTNTTAGNTYLWTVTGGSIVGSNSGSSITVVWAASGSGTITVKQTNTFTCDSTVTKNITINPTPAPVITGPTPVCAYKQTSYSTNTTAGNTYLWTVTGGSIVGSNSGSSVTVLWAASGSGTVTVKQTNTFTCDSTVTKNITITPTPAPTITGPTPVCAYKQTSYSTNTTAGNTYLWTVTGGSIVGGNTGSSITVLWAASGSGTVTVKQTNTFTCDSTVTKNITINPTPFPVITGPTPVCAYKQTSYSTNTTAGNTYLWTVTGGTIVGSNTNSSVTIAWGASGSGTVTVKQTNSFTCDSTVTKNITITPTPFPTITGPTPVCAYKQTSYSTNITAGNTYLWTVTGGSIIGSNAGSSITVLWGASGSGTVTIKQTNTFTCDSTVTKNITINPTPFPTITGPTPVCAYKQTSYSTNTTAGNTYQWTVTGGSIVGSNSGSSITVLWAASGSGTVTVKQTNTFTCDSTVTKNITINPTPAPVITGPGTVCSYKQTSYSTNTTAGNTYQWTVTGGSIIGSNTGSSIDVLWAANGSGTVTVKQTNTFTCDSAVTKNITITPTPAPFIAGPTTVCEYKPVSYYSTNTNPGMQYLWTVTGGYIIGNNTDSIIDVIWAGTGSGSVTVKQTNSFNCDSTVSVSITITPTPAPVITGPDTVCEYKQTSYSTNTTAGNTYQWTVTGGSIIGSNTGTSISVLWSTNGSGTVTIKQTNTFHCDSILTHNIFINPTPTPVITGPTPVCSYKQTSYSTNTTAGNSYQWVVTGGTIVGSDTNSTVTIAWSTNGSGTVTIKQTNLYDCDSSITKNITITPTPAPVITGRDSVCEYKQYSYSTNTTAGNTYQWSVTGGFIIGSATGTSINVIWAANGNGTVTVKQTNTFTCDSTITKNIIITHTPAPIITGINAVCEYKQLLYSTNTTPGNTYLWTVTGGNIVGSNTDTTLLVAWGANGTGTVTLKQTNLFNCDSIVSINITISPTPAPFIAGPATVCEYKPVSYYSTNTTPGMLYQWTVTGGYIIGNSTDSIIDVIWAANGIGSVTVKQTNSFNCDSTISVSITITPTPAPVITGPDTVCEYKQTSYSTNTTAGNTYQWTVTGGSIIGSNTGTSINVLWSTNGSGTVTIKQTNTFHCDSTISINILIRPTPVPVITGPATVCEYKQTSYSTNTTAGNSYQWSVNGGTIIGSDTNSSVTIAWGINGSGTVTVVQTNPYDCDSAITKNITITPTPAPVITGRDSVCEYKQYSYSTNTTAGNTYQWSVTGGFIIGSATGTFINVIWAANGNGTVTVKQTNSFSCDSSVTKNIVITPTPAPVIIGLDSVCEYKLGTYTTNTTPGNLYQWGVTGGTIIGRDDDTIVQVRWDVHGTGNIVLNQMNSFSCDSTVSLPVIITPSPTPTIAGPVTTCEYKPVSYYSTNVVPGNTYQWNIIGGYIIGSGNNSTVDVIWAGTGIGNITIVQTNSFGCDSAVSLDVTITPTPATTIIGPDSVCEFQRSIYTTNTTLGNTYQWTVTGGSILGSSTDTTITVLWSGNGSGNVKLKQTNLFGCDSIITLNILINSTPVPTISGPGTVCEHKQYTYSTNPTAGFTYEWSVTQGEIIGSSTNSSVTILWDSTSSGSLSIKQTNPVGCDSSVVTNITITPTPVPVINGPDTVCEYRQTIYTTNTTVGNAYQWSVTGGTIVGSSTDTTVRIFWNANGNGTITIKQTNLFTCDSITTKNIRITPTPVPVIIGPASVCEFKRATVYSTNTTSGNTYQWVVTGGSIVGSNTDSAITVAWGSTGNGSVTLTQTNRYGCDSTVKVNISINPTPAPTILQPDTVCEYKESSYTTNSATGNTYQWSVTGGFIIGSNTDTTVRVIWGSRGTGVVTVKQINLYNCDSIIQINILIKPAPTPFIIGANPVCEHKQIVYRANAINGNTYHWIVTGGTIVGSSTDTLVRILWGTTGNGTITITQTNTQGCDSTITKNIQILTTPVAIINGPDSICSFKTSIFSTPSIAGMKYKWAMTGGSISGSDSATSANIVWGHPGAGSISLKVTNSLGCDSTLTLPINIMTSPIPIINGDTSVCEFQRYTYKYSTFYKAVNNYQWTATGGTIVGTSTDTIVQVIFGGTDSAQIQLHVINVSGCDSTVSVSIHVRPKPHPAITGPDTICQRKLYTYSTVNASGDSYQWSVTGAATIDTSTSNVLKVVWDSTGNKVITLIEKNIFGCDSAVTFKVFAKPTPIPTLSGVTSICEYKTAVYTARKISNDQYAWSITNGTILSVIADTQAIVQWGSGDSGIISVTETNAQGCDSTIKLNVDLKPTPIPIIYGPNPTCEFKSYIYTSNYFPNHTYQWTVTGGTWQQVDDTTIAIKWGPTGTGTISLKITSPFLCDSTVIRSIDIKPTPVPNFSGLLNLCAYTASTYTATSAFSGHKYEWSVSGGTIAGPSDAPVVTIVWGQPGLGQLTLKQTSADGCDSSITKTIQLRSRPTPLINGPKITCAGGWVYTYSATPAFGHYKYDWAVTNGNIESGTGTPQVEINWKTKGNQRITLHVTDSITLCDSTVILDIFVDSVLKPVLNANQLAGCLPLSIEFIGNDLTPGYNYLWDFGDGSSSTQPNPRYVYTKPGVFNAKVVVVNSNGCRDSAMATVIVNYIPKADFNYSYQNERIYAHEDTVNFENRSTGGNMFVWRISKGHGDDTDTSYDDKTQYVEPGFYDVVLTTIDTATGCKDSVTKRLEVRVREELYVPNAFSPNGDGVNEYFYVSVTNIVEFEMLIFNRWGEIMFRTNDKNFKWDGNFEGKPAQADVYAYLLSGKGYHGKFFSKKGTITLLR